MRRTRHRAFPPWSGAWDKMYAFPVTERLIFYALLHVTWFGNKMWQMDGFNLPEDAFLVLESAPLNA